MTLDINEFQTTWWGSPVGIVRDASFFDLELDVQVEQLKQYSWVEYRTTDLTNVLFNRLVKSRFHQWDTQLVYRLNLQGVTASSSVDKLEVITAGEVESLHEFGWSAETVQTFASERFRVLPGIDDSKLNSRFLVWGADLIKKHPDTCVVVKSEGQICGWMLARPNGRKLNLALGANAINSPASGLYVYQAATRYYANKGWRLATASLSASNHKALNVHAQLGVRFVQPEFHFVWLG